MTALYPHLLLLMRVWIFCWGSLHHSSRSQSLSSWTDLYWWCLCLTWTPKASHRCSITQLRGTSRPKPCGVKCCPGVFNSLWVWPGILSHQRISPASYWPWSSSNECELRLICWLCVVWGVQVWPKAVKPEYCRRATCSYGLIWYPNTSCSLRVIPKLCNRLGVCDILLSLWWKHLKPGGNPVLGLSFTCCVSQYPSASLSMTQQPRSSLRPPGNETSLSQAALSRSSIIKWDHFKISTILLFESATLFSAKCLSFSPALRTRTDCVST